ncbi:hypothetical protein [Lactiplantibacillus carotarum]|uniref:hypothetical protein n=1 Tax=Lactiplantibacillus carotarum TaxID=2993456 RepID=UPI00298EEEB1|nr:hypothetical protein [Lactiplantibacillus carotarum]
MERLDSLWLKIVYGCFLNLIIALTQWAGIVTGRIIGGINLVVSLIMIILVIISAVRLSHQRRVPMQLRQRIWITNSVALLIALFTEWY